MRGGWIVFTTQHHHELHGSSADSLCVIDRLDNSVIGIRSSDAIACHVSICDLVPCMGERLKEAESVLIEGRWRRQMGTEAAERVRKGNEFRAWWLAVVV